MQKIRCYLLLQSTILAFIVTANTQSFAEDDQHITQTEIELEKITVTSQRRIQNIQKVPISVTAFSAPFLTNNDVRTIEDLNGTIPGFFAANSTNYGAAPMSIRGIGGANGGGNTFSDEPVAVYVDDVYIARPIATTSDLIDIEQIQVMRGPQGTLYGRNSTAGALLINTARPTEDFEGYLRGSFAQYGEQRLSTAISGPVSDYFLARLAIGYTNRDGWADNIFDGTNLASSNSSTARLSISYAPSSEFTADLIAEKQKREANPATLAVTNLTPAIASSPFVVRDDLKQLLNSNRFQLNSANKNNVDLDSVTLKMNWDSEVISVNSITSIRGARVDGNQDSDGTQFLLFNNEIYSDSDQWSQEIRLSSNNTDKLSWIIGAYFLDESIEQLSTINNFQGLLFAGISSTFDANQDAQAIALFGDATLRVTEKLTLVAGIRYSKETKEFENSIEATTIGNSIPLPFSLLGLPVGSVIPRDTVVSPLTQVSDQEDFTDTSFRLLINYDFTDQILGYVSYNQGFKSGGFNSFALASAFNSENIDAYEFGLKSDLLNSKVRLNGSAFYYDYTNLQVRLPVPTGGVNIENAGQADVSGIEFELTYVLTSDFTLSANATWMNSELTEFLTTQIPGDAIFLIGAPIPLEEVNAKGNELTRAPDLQYFIHANYVFDISPSIIGMFNANLRHQDSVFFLETNQNANTYAGDDVTELGLRLSLESVDEKWSIGVYGQNITNERTVTQVASLGGFPNAALNEPRKWGIDFAYNF